MRKFKLIHLLSLIVLSSCTACNQPISFQPEHGKPFGGGPGGPGGNSGNSEVTMKITAQNAADPELLTGDEVRADDITVNDVLSIDLGALTYSLGDSAAVAISSDAKIQDGNFSITLTQADCSGSYIKISSSADAAKISLGGTLEKGSVEIEPKKNSSLILEMNGASVYSANYAPLNVSKAAMTYLVLSGENSLVDGRSYGTGYSEEEGTDYYSSGYAGEIEEGAELTQKWEQGSDCKASLYAKGPLVISGDGSLEVKESYKHGLYSKDYIHVVSGTVSVNSSGRNCIRSCNGFVMDGGKLTLNGTGSHTNDESRGIIVEGDEDNPGEGFIYITGGQLNVETVGKAVSAKWDIEEDAETSGTDDDPNPVVVITGGTFSIKTSAAVVDEERSRTVSYYDADGIQVSETRSCSPEGIEGKLGVVISGGTFCINTTDDCINASRDGDGFVNISGGQIYAYSTSGDCIDSNGDINISGGTVLAVSTMGSEDGFDCDGDLTFTGGIAAGISGSSKYYASTSNQNSTQNAFVLGSSVAGSAGSTMAVEDGSGSPVFVLDLPSGISYGLVTLSSPEFKSGQSYCVKSGVSASGGTSFYGLYTSMPSVSGGSGGTSIATSDGLYVYATGVSSGGFGRFAGEEFRGIRY